MEYAGLRQVGISLTLPSPLFPASAVHGGERPLQCSRHTPWIPQSIRDVAAELSYEWRACDDIYPSTGSLLVLCLARIPYGRLGAGHRFLNPLNFRLNPRASVVIHLRIVSSPDVPPRSTRFRHPRRPSSVSAPLRTTQPTRFVGLSALGCSSDSRQRCDCVEAHPNAFPAFAFQEEAASESRGRSSGSASSEPSPAPE
jgi:hypothetical protein